ncbi:response regulator [Fischerella thermalis]|nr:response regulator [Fischerella thermalis]
MTSYQAGQLHNLLQDLQMRKVSGVFYIDINRNTEKNLRTRVLILNNGSIVYGGLKFINNQDFARNIGKKLNHTWAENAIKFAVQKLQNPSSFREILDIVVRIRVFKWEEIEDIVHTQVVQVLELALPNSGSLRIDSNVECDLGYGKDNHGLDWPEIMQDVTRRQQQWTTLSAVFPYMDAVPKLTPKGLQVVTDSAVRQHLQQWVDGKRSLIDIAEQLDQDPLKLAESYMTWATSGWMILEGYPSVTPAVPFVKPKKPIVLSVDDSIIVQAMIQQTLGDRYELILANNAIDALKTINTQPVELLLLDVTMPGIDGLEFCRTVRRIPKFKQLPIIMLTARNKFSDKLRGQIAGATHYLTKPFEHKQLLELVEKCIYW